ncbi:MAG: hypothetical protein GX665_05275 [Gammaproteobacteria bacterium]|nr:hypothetical protein [Gammaproteobacteria bacterium]
MYVKRIGLRTVAVEVICALLAGALDLPCPRPALVKAQSGTLAGIQGEEILFGSETISSPDLRHFVSAGSQEVIERLMEWSKATQAGCFDEWIGNEDRHVGNILYGGPGTFTLIDHSEAIPAWLTPDTPNGVNTLLNGLAATQQQPEQLYQGAKAHTQSYSTACIDTAALGLLETLAGSATVNELVIFLQHRIQHLLPLVSHQLGLSQHSLALADA